MWRASIWRRLLLLIGAVGLSVLVTFLGVGPAPSDGYLSADSSELSQSDRELSNLVKHLKVRFGHDVSPQSARIIVSETESINLGKVGVLWFESRPQSREPNDIFRCQFTLSRTGVPVAMDQPFNLTQSNLGDESILDVDADRLLFSVSQGGKAERVIFYDFSDERGRAQGLFPRIVESIESMQLYGHTQTPLRSEMVLKTGYHLTGGELGDGGYSVQGDEGSISVDLRGGRVEPAALGTLLSAVDERFDTERRAWSVLGRTDMFGVDRVISVSRLSVGLAAWFEHQVQLILGQVTSTGPELEGLQTVNDALWPPSPILVDKVRKLAGEGEWSRPDGVTRLDEPTILTTFVRPNPQRVYERVRLYAFDMRRLGLDFVAGADEPRSDSGARGVGRVQATRRKYVVAAFNGGLDSSKGRFGAIERGTTLVAPSQGLATVAIDGDGRPAFGQWDASSLMDPWVSMRQNLPPLLDRQIVNPGRVTGWGQTVRSLDGAHMTRSALGVTDSGIVIYAWSESTTAKALGNAMRMAGVQFAMHLDLGRAGNGIEFFSDGVDGDEKLAGTPKMSVSSRGWTGTASRGFFYLFKAGRLSRAGERLQRSALVDSEVDSEQLIDGVPVVARTVISAETLKSDEDVSVYLLEAAQLRPHFVPGLAEVRPSGVDARSSLVLPTAPLASFGVGLRSAGSPHGLTVERRVWRTARLGVMTLVVDAEGNVQVDRYGDGAIDTKIRWSTLIQGPTLLSRGHLGDSAKGATGLPAVAAGLTRDGLVAVALSGNGDRRALAMALQRIEVGEALLLGERGTADTGEVRLFFEQDGEFTMRVGDKPALEPADASPRAGSAFMLTARRPRASARFLSTFMRVRLTRDDSGVSSPRP